jgi:hypothetical protein
MVMTMQAWLNNIENKVRVSVCINDLKQDLETASQRQRAEILVMAQYLRIHLLEQSGIRRTSMDNPLECPRPDITAQLHLIEQLRRQLRTNLRHVVRGRFSETDQMPVCSHRQTQNMACALELWFCTMGACFVPEKHYMLCDIWTTMANSRTCLQHTDAIRQCARTLPIELSDFNCIGRGAFNSADEWLVYYDFIPSAFNSEIAAHKIRGNHESIPAR